MKTEIGAGLSQSISQQGGRFYYMEGKGEIEIKLKTGGDTRRFALKPGKGIAMREGERFDGLEIVNLLSESQEVEFEVSDREVFDNRVTGNVYVVDSNREVSQAAKSFGRARERTAGAGEYANILFFNESDKLMSVGVFDISVDAGARVRVCAASNIVIANSADSEIAPGEAGQNKRLGAQESGVNAYPAKTTSTTPDFADIGQPMVNVYIGGNATYNKKMDFPIIIEPGRGLLFTALSPAVGITAIMDWEEYEN